MATWDRLSTPPHPLPGHNDGQIRYLPTTSLAGGNKGSFTRTVNITVFMSGTFDLFDVVCQQLHIATLNLFLSGTNVTGSRLLSYRKNTWLRMMCCLQIIWWENRKFQWGHGVLPFCVGRTWFKLAVTSSNQFLPVVVHDK